MWIWGHGFSLWRHWFCRELCYTGRQIQQLCLSARPWNKHFRISNALDDICLLYNVGTATHLGFQTVQAVTVHAVSGETSWTTINLCCLLAFSHWDWTRFLTPRKVPRFWTCSAGKSSKTWQKRTDKVSKDIENQLYRILLIVTWFDFFKFSCFFKLEDIRNFASSFVTKHGGRQLLFLSSCPSSVWEGTCFRYILPCKHFSETGGLETAVEESKPRTGFRIRHQTRMTEQFAKRDMSVEFEQPQATRFERGRSGWTAAACRGVKCWCFSWEVVLIIDHYWLVQNSF